MLRVTMLHAEHDAECSTAELVARFANFPSGKILVERFCGKILLTFLVESVLVERFC